MFDGKKIKLTGAQSVIFVMTGKIMSRVPLKDYCVRLSMYMQRLV